MFQIGIHIIKRLETIHRKGIVPRDIKANNFIMGRDKKEILCILLILGLRTDIMIQKQEGTYHLISKSTSRYSSIA